MEELNNLIINAVKQLCRRAAYELEFDLKESNTKSDIICGKRVLSDLYSDPHKHLSKFTHAKDEAVLEQNISELISLNGFNKSETKFLHFLNNLKNMQPGIENKWIWLRHYMHYIYRDFIVSDPNPTFDDIPSALLVELRKLVTDLLNNDECQLLAKIVALLREYCLYANNVYTMNCKKDKTTASRLFHYYEAILEAAKNVKSVFPEFEALFEKNYSVGWIDLNTTIFIYFFFDVSYLQENLYEFLKSTEKSTIKSLLIDLSKLWSKEQYRISSINENIYRDPPKEEIASLMETKRLMKYNFWILRSAEAKTSFSKNWLDHQIINVITVKCLDYTGGILDDNGNCLCEDCSIAKCKAFMESQKVLKPDEKYLACNKCHSLTLIQHFAEHILGGCKSQNITNGETRVNGEDVKVATQLPSTKKLANTNCSSTEGLNSAVGKNSKDLIKVLSSKTEKILPNSSTPKSPFIKSKSEIPNKSEPVNDDGTKKSVISIKKDLYNFKENYDKGYVQAKEDFRKYAEKVICDHHHKEKKCDCSHCEADNSHTHKSNVLRNRLRSRLNQRRDKRTKGLNFTKITTPTTTTTVTKPNVVKEEERITPMNITPVVPALEKHDDKSIHDIHGLLNYIEGNKNPDKATLAKKKAEKKARQRQKKEEQRLEIERKEREAKEAELRARQAQKKIEEDLARQLQEKLKLSSKGNNDTKGLKKKKKDKQDSNTVVEETIPAMVTIKRLVNSDNTPPTVTITLKGSSPDQDKLLYTLVNGGDKKDNAETNNKNNINKKKEDTTKNSKKKSKNDTKNESNSNIIAKELKVTIELDPTSSKTDKKAKKLEKTDKKLETTKKQPLDLPMLRLPPGITITKVDGPVSNRSNYRVDSLNADSDSTIKVNQSGVIVVDTEKLIQQTNPGGTSKKKGRRKKKKLNEEIKNSHIEKSGEHMITLKNPIFQTFQPKTYDDSNDSHCAPAAIFTNENGMVTIRSSRLQQSLNAGGKLTPLNQLPLTPDLKPILGPDVPTTALATSNSFTVENKPISAINAQEILSGLPGIEITKVDKKSKAEDVNKVCQTAQVSIIPTNNNNDHLNIEKDDWTYDVFTPKDILEDDMDADERELEAFKRFCQQSVPPKRKEKVAHLNVKDIILKKKNDANI